MQKENKFKKSNWRRSHRHRGHHNRVFKAPERHQGQASNDS